MEEPTSFEAAIKRKVEARSNQIHHYSHRTRRRTLMVVVGFYSLVVAALHGLGVVTFRGWWIFVFAPVVIDFATERFAAFPRCRCERCDRMNAALDRLEAKSKKGIITNEQLLMMVMGALACAVITSLVLAAGKLTHAVDWTWPGVFAPVFITTTVILMIFAIDGVYLQLRRDDK